MIDGYRDEFDHRSDLTHWVRDDNDYYKMMDIIDTASQGKLTVEEKVDGAFGFMVGRHRFYIPFSDGFDIETEKAKIQKDLDYQLGFLKAVRGKLSNENFVNGAPEAVVANERSKEADSLAKIAILEENNFWTVKNATIVAGVTGFGIGMIAFVLWARRPFAGN